MSFETVGRRVLLIVKTVGYSSLDVLTLWDLRGPHAIQNILRRVQHRPLEAATTGVGGAGHVPEGEHHKLNDTRAAWECFIHGPDHYLQQ